MAACCAVCGAFMPLPFSPHTQLCTRKLKNNTVGLRKKLYRTTIFFQKFQICTYELSSIFENCADRLKFWILNFEFPRNSPESGLLFPEVWDDMNNRQEMSSFTVISISSNFEVRRPYYSTQNKYESSFWKTQEEFKLKIKSRLQLTKQTDRWLHSSQPLNLIVTAMVLNMSVTIITNTLDMLLYVS